MDKKKNNKKIKWEFHNSSQEDNENSRIVMLICLLVTEILCKSAVCTFFR